MNELLFCDLRTFKNYNEDSYQSKGCGAQRYFTLEPSSLLTSQQITLPCKITRHPTENQSKIKFHLLHKTTNCIKVHCSVIRKPLKEESPRELSPQKKKLNNRNHNNFTSITNRIKIMYLANNPFSIYSKEGTLKVGQKKKSLFSI